VVKWSGELIMYRPWPICVIVVCTLFGIGLRTEGQTSSATEQGAASFHLNVAVDEVSLTFHAADAHGLPVNDLKSGELGILDNGTTPMRVLVFQSLQNLPIRAGILMDMSESMSANRAADRAIAIQYVQQLLRQETDQAFVMNFERLSTVGPWTNNAFELVSGIRNRDVGESRRVHREGTAIFDTVYGACLNQFGHLENATTGNFILLLTDGEDNSSRIPMKKAVDICQRANTAIYAFRPAPNFGDAVGAKMLAELTRETGGRLFYDDDLQSEIDKNLRSIEANLRTQYRLIYRPQELKRDGSFHRIELKTPLRVESVTIRSGYFSPMPR
jgi:Ca-activated chloride channel family protein